MQVILLTVLTRPIAVVLLQAPCLAGNDRQQCT